MTINQTLVAFLKAEEAVQKALTDLKEAAKNEGTKLMQETIQENGFEEASYMLEQLKRFAKIVYESNANDIKEYTTNVFKVDLSDDAVESIGRTIQEVYEGFGFQVSKGNGCDFEIKIEETHYFATDVRGKTKEEIAGLLDKQKGLLSVLLHTTKKEYNFVEESVGLWLVSQDTKNALLKIHVGDENGIREAYGFEM